MNIDEVFSEIDRLFMAGESEKAEEYILEKLSEATQADDENAMIQLLNELIGYYRETGKFDRMTTFAGKLLGILDASSLNGSMAHATSLLNVANAYRAAGMLKESNTLYQQVKSYYDANVSPDSMLYASLLNNMSLLFQEMGDFESAADCLERALGISLKYDECRIEQATTYANLATTLIKLDRLDEAEDNVNKAFELFEKDENRDYHYSAALTAMAEIKYIKKDYRKSVEYYQKALEEIEKCVGRSKAYEITKQNMQLALDHMKEGITGLELAKLYYEQYGRPMIHEKFPKYEDRIAVGLVGEGSECFGYDDEQSTDHDFGPGFCMWLAKDDHKKIGKKLQEEYDKLPDEFMGYRRLDSEHARKRVGVFSVGKFYKQFIGIKTAPATDEEWLRIPDEGFAHAVNGEVFADELGGFTYIRKKIREYYPENVWRRKIAQAAALMSQSGQYNYPRMVKRGDLVSAAVYMARFMESTMQMMYYLNRQYAPYVKWMYKGLEQFDNAYNIRIQLAWLTKLKADDDQVIHIIENICTEVLMLLNENRLASLKDNYLDHHIVEILGGKMKKVKEQKEPKEKKKKLSKDKLIEKIVSLEWKAFDKVDNQGGRASCQDDWGTFSIMRKSQYMLWDEEMLESFIADFEAANKKGWNLITEKYGRMEETSAPEEYEKIKDSLPPVSDEKRQIIEAIVAVQVSMMEEFARDYPKAAGEARSIHTSEDTPHNTSYETYLRGEISTYSDNTLALYGRFVAAMAQTGRNIAKETIENSAKLYGYASLDDMESKL